MTQRNTLIWVIPTFLLVAAHVLLARESPSFGPDLPLVSRPILWMAGLWLAAGGCYLAAIHQLCGGGRSRQPLTPERFGSARSRIDLALIALVGISLRLALFPSTPIQEDDYYRYLWDGGVSAHGLNPFRLAPEEVLRESNREKDEPYRELARRSNGMVSKVNHAHLRTIYPPLAQVAFAVAHWIEPWSLIAWRMVILGFDLVTFVLLILILKTLRLSPLWATVYWWNPLITKEGYNSAHMDGLALPLVLGAVLLSLRGRSRWGVATLGLATGVKIWPVVLLPVLLQPLWRGPARGKAIVGALGAFVVIVASMFYPVYQSGFDSSSGFAAYARNWEMNDALFMALLWGIEAFRDILNALNGDGMGTGILTDSQTLARGTAGLALCLWSYWVLSKRPRPVTESALLILAATFFLSPTQFPWYYWWVLPFLAMHPRPPLLLLSVLLSLYYLRFHFKALGQVELFDSGIVWLEYLPVWAWLIYDWLRDASRQHSAFRRLASAVGGLFGKSVRKKW